MKREINIKQNNYIIKKISLGITVIIMITILSSATLMYLMIN